MFEFVTWLFINPAFFVTSVVDLKVLNCTKYKIRLELHFTLSILKVGTHDATSPCNKSQGLVASCELATSPCD